MNSLANKIQLDFRSNEPLYLQITRQMQQLVVSGGLRTGDQLPTVRELATELRINFNTVARAYRLLDETRLISTQRGRGTYIWEQPSEETMKQTREKSLAELARNFWNEAEKLGYSLEDALEALKFFHSTGDQAGPENQENKEL